mgnify:CR=1 FL=1
MPRTDSPLIHPTAIISPEACIADGVRIGPYAIIDGPVTIETGCRIGPHCHLLGRLSLGRDNTVGTGCVLGAEPQHLGYQGEDTVTIIGDGNIFREHVTVHRGMPGTPGTIIGHNNLFMVNSHVAHDCHVGNHCTFANGAVIGGHSVIADRALLSGNTCVHQFCRVGRMALLSGTSSISQDLPPFWIAQGGVNVVQGVNVIGMRRAGIPAAEIQAVRRAFRMIHLQGLTISAAVAKIEAEVGDLPAIRELVDFIRSARRGICSGRARLASPDSESTTSSSDSDSKAA